MERSAEGEKESCVHIAGICKIRGAVGSADNAAIGASAQCGLKDGWDIGRRRGHAYAGKPTPENALQIAGGRCSGQRPVEGETSPWVPGVEAMLSSSERRVVVI